MPDEDLIHNNLITLNLWLSSELKKTWLGFVSRILGDFSYFWGKLSIHPLNLMEPEVGTCQAPPKNLCTCTIYRSVLLSHIRIGSNYRKMTNFPFKCYSFITPCADPESFVRGGPTSNWQLFFLKIWWGREDANTTIISGPSLAHQQNTMLACWWWPNIECWLGSYVIFRGSRPVLLRNPLFLWFFRGVQTPVPPLDLLMYTVNSYRP